MASLTVVTVVRNDPDGLRATMASLADQTALPDQVLVVDGSDDRASIPEALAPYAALPVSVDWSPPEGVYAAMNDGLGRANCEYIYFLNAGDTLHDSAVIADVVDQLGAAHPRWAVGRVEFRAENGTVLPAPEWDYDSERAALFARGRFPAHQGVVVRTAELRNQGGFDMRYVVAADYLSVLRLARDGAPLHLDRALAVFTVGGISTQDWQRGLREFHRARTEVFTPAGAAAVVEQIRTTRTLLATSAYRSLWAPGRPLAGLAARVRGSTGR